MSPEPGEPAATRSASPPIGLIAGVVVLLLIVAGSVWFWRLRAANAAEAAAKTALEQKEVILVADGGHVKVLNNMRKLDDATFANIGGLSYLHTCNLSGSEVTDAQMAVLGTLPGLLILQVDHSPAVTSAGLAPVANLSTLERLFANDTSIDDAGLAHLSGLPNLNTVDISHTKVTDAGLKHLVGVPKLEVLRICGNDISDAGVESLKQMTSLKLLNVGGTKITPEGVKALRAAKKDLVVEESESSAR